MKQLSREIARTIVWLKGRNRFFECTRQNGRRQYRAISEPMATQPARIPAYVLERFQAGSTKAVITLEALWAIYETNSRDTKRGTQDWRRSLWRRIAAALDATRSLDSFTAADIGTLRSADEAAGITRWQHTVHLLTEMFRLAVALYDQTGLERSPFGAVRVSAPESKGRPWDPDAIRRVQAVAEALPAGDPKRLVWAYARLMLLLGTRPGELRTLPRAAVTPWGIKTNVFKRGRETFKVVEMTPMLDQIIDEVDRFPRKRDVLFGYWGTDGTARVSIQALWDELVASAGGERMRLHDARSTLGTATTKLHGLRAAQLALGHASFATTERHYVHDDQASRVRIDATESLLAAPAAAGEAQRGLGE